MTCDALDWDKTDEDYVPCSDSDEAERVQLEGLLLTVTANLCQAHQKYFWSKPPKWGAVKISDPKTGKAIEFWQGKRI